MKTHTNDMPKAYDPKAVEERLYAWWEAQGYFQPETQFALGLAKKEQKPFVISMPPPNVTGELHLGHAITATVEDIMIRWHRMCGQPTLWVPGSDHASIAVHYMIDKTLAARSAATDELLAEAGFPPPPDKRPLTRWDLGREQFIKLGWAWRARYGGIIKWQHARLGASCDWQRERFTLDEGLSRAVREAFVRLYERGLIYKGKRMINWCPRCLTAISDLEVEHEDEAGSLWYVRYQLTGDDGEYIVVATTRPETILGDTAVAVHPHDARYADSVGRYAILPVLWRTIPIIADEAVDQAFGTGAVKVTPAHDPTDYEIAQRHNLPAIDAMNPDGTMNENAGPYNGLDRYECRRRLIEQLQREGLLLKTVPHTSAIGHCQRCGTIVEPRISEQWFVSAKPLAEAALAAVADGRIRIVPEHFTKVYNHWLENIRDWNISRQLWWGHRIPVWYCRDCGEVIVARQDPTSCPKCGGSQIEQDPDILDTWFSSALWPFSTLGWPDQTPDLAYFYPTSVLETGYDILFFWVARMIMMGLAMTDNIPFDTVYLHGMIRDEKGEKMSKTKGNAVDPLDLMEEFGTDALRFALATGSTPGSDMKLSPTKLQDARNFANKLWNAARLILMNLDDPAAALQHTLPAPEALPAERGSSQSGFTLADRWILSRAHRLTEAVNRLMASYEFGEAGRQIYDFLWSEFCDWYLEIAKSQLRSPELKAHTQAIMAQVLERTLRLLHPFMPFVTEEIWQRLARGARDEERGTRSEERGAASIMLAPYPTADERFFDAAAEEQMGLVMELVRSIRNARAEFGVEPAKRIEALIAAGQAKDLLVAQTKTLVTLARLDPAKLRIAATPPEKPKQALSLLVGGVECYLPLAAMVDLAAERARTEKEIAAAQADVARGEKLLGSDFASKAPAAIVEKEREKLAANRQRLAQLATRLASLSS
jgi:valyl-tRNA synthetase